ncbi:alpha/beta fold hydrolase [Granulicella sp. 5B5]|uniref:alpha/beta fold hydrolase n=1 Tax=Granulicella sp. 5B5 TaxID=1617967 RepID=UPI0015F67A71|nr:alpha/beta hydrolase [Granulicella sp. 5B5]QMV17466.1 alpha/beta fold hydrolase [Granulicella sp. 5B5]
MPERRHLQLDGLHLSYLETGTAIEGRPTLVLLHGLMGSAATFLPFMNELGDELHVIALDLPGSGLSERRPDLSADLKSTTLSVASFLDALQLHKPIILGHSHGGAIALRLAAKFPDRLTSLALLAPAHPFFVEANPVVRFYLSLPGRLFAHTMPWFPQWMQMIGLRRMAGPQSWDSPERLQPYRENLRTPGTIAHLLKLLRTWNDDMASLGRLLRKPLSTPTLVLWGSADRAVPVYTARELCARLKQPQFHVLEGIGHRPAEETPALVAELVQQLVLSASTARNSRRRTQPAFSPKLSSTHERIAPLITSSFEAGD